VDLLKRLNEIGFERTRRALAALALSLFVFFYLLLSFNAPEGWGPAFLALSMCYAVAFMGVAAEWFWGRWFADGLGWSGLLVAVASLFMIGWTPVLAIYGALHGVVVLALAGKKMAERFDLQPTWRERYGMDEFGVARLRKTVTRASASLPSVILWALGPKNPEEGMLFAGICVLAGALAVVGLAGVIRLRTWGLAALVGAGALLLPFANVGIASLRIFDVGCPGIFCPANQALGWAAGSLGLGAAFPAALLILAVAPFAGPLVRHLTRRT
jgi:hypothetical protein